MDKKGNGMMEYSPDDAGAEVVTTLTKYVAKKLPKNHKCKRISEN